MEFQKVIDSRSSVRKFEETIVPEDILEEIITNATKAPSACNRQPWIFYVVNSKNKRDEVSKILKKTLISLKQQVDKKSDKMQKITYDFYNDLGGAQNIIFIYRKKELNEKPWILPSDIQSISCAAENIMLSAIDKGLGTCCVGSFKDPESEKKVSEIINSKGNEELVISLLIGYPSKNFKPLRRDKKKIYEVLNFI